MRSQLWVHNGVLHADFTRRWVHPPPCFLHMVGAGLATPGARGLLWEGGGDAEGWCCSSDDVIQKLCRGFNYPPTDLNVASAHLVAAQSPGRAASALAAVFPAKVPWGRGLITGQRPEQRMGNEEKPSCLGGQPEEAVFRVQERKQFLEIGVVRGGEVEGAETENPLVP